MSSPQISRSAADSRKPLRGGTKPLRLGTPKRVNSGGGKAKIPASALLKTSRGNQAACFDPATNLLAMTSPSPLLASGRNHNREYKGERPSLEDTRRPKLKDRSDSGPEPDFLPGFEKLKELGK